MVFQFMQVGVTCDMGEVLVAGRGMPKMSNKAWLAVITGLLTANAAWAGSQLEAVRSNCTTFNCAGMTVRGVVQGNEPFVVQVFAGAGDCLRLDVSQQTHDLVMHMIGPFLFAPGSVGDDRGGGDLRPLIVYNNIDVGGWYTIIVSLRDTASVNAKFKLEYGRYSTDNDNCLAA